MNFSKDFIEVLNLVQPDDFDSIKLIDGSMLKGKHVLLHEVNEAALYQMDPSVEDINLQTIIRFSSYPQEYRITIFTRQLDKWIHNDASITEMQNLKNHNGICFVYFPPVETQVSMRSFEELVAHLRSEEGCPWDREQTHLTLRSNLLEESYEVLDAIDNEDDASLKEELGDLLLQIFLHSQIASERGAFHLSDVVLGIHQKITSRHPHVFKDWDVDNSLEVIKNWELLKSREREQKGIDPSTSILASVPKTMPALSLAQEYQKRAARVGFDWPEITPVIEKVKEEFSEVLEAKNREETESELGDLLFALVNLVRWYGEDAESVLRKMNMRFYKRFHYMENRVAEKGKKLNQLSLAEMDKLWEDAKELENRES